MAEKGTRSARTETRARSKRRSTYVPNQTQYGSTLERL